MSGVEARAKSEAPLYCLIAVAGLAGGVIVAWLGLGAAIALGGWIAG